MDSLIKSEAYEDYAKVIEAAVRNLVTIHRELGGKNSLVLAGDKKSEAALSEPKHAPSNVHEIPFIFTREAIRQRPTNLAVLPTDASSSRQAVPLRNWVFGQYNRLLPAKVVCRGLAHLLRSSPHGVPAKEAAREITRHAALLGDYLADTDSQLKRDRDHALATAFPFTGSVGDKSRLRFERHFVATVTRAGGISSLPVELKMMDSVPGKEPLLLLTEPGWEFAAQANPVLDGIELNGKNLSASETHFLLDHIAKAVPAEHFALQTILAAVHAGANTPKALDAALLECVPSPPDSGLRMTDAFRTSQRAGAVARMVDLSLLRRIRVGVEVSYALTVLGTEQLQARA
jgi:hypothetical protein